MTLELKSIKNVLQIITVKLQSNWGILKLWPQVDLWLWMTSEVIEIYSECSKDHPCQICAQLKHFQKYDPKLTFWPWINSEEILISLDCYQDNTCQFWAQSEHFENLTPVEPTDTLIDVWLQHICTHIIFPIIRHKHTIMNLICHWVKKMQTTQKAYTKSLTHKLTDWHTHRKHAARSFLTDALKTLGQDYMHLVLQSK